LFNSSPVEDFGEVDGFEGIARAREEALEMHEATGIVGDDVIGAGLVGGGAFHLAHGGGDHGKFDGERAAEAAAGLGLGHLDEFKVADVGEQGARRFFDAEFAQAVAAIVKGDAGGKARAEIGDTELGDEEIREFPDAGGKGRGGGGVRGVREEFTVKDLEHRAAGTGRDDDGFGVLEGLQDLEGDGAGLVPIAGVEGGLAAAGEIFRIFDAMAEAFKDLDDADADARKGEVHEAGDEHGDGHGDDIRAGRMGIAGGIVAGTGRRLKREDAEADAAREA
jgi:hypothetical protein